MAYKAIDKALLMTVGTIEPSIAPKVVPSIHPAVEIEASPKK